MVVSMVIQGVILHVLLTMVRVPLVIIWLLLIFLIILQSFEVSHRDDSDHFPVAACLTLPHQKCFVEQHIIYIENEFINLVTYKWRC